MPFMPHKAREEHMLHVALLESIDSHQICPARFEMVKKIEKWVAKGSVVRVVSCSRHIGNIRIILLTGMSTRQLLGCLQPMPI